MNTKKHHKKTNGRKVSSKKISYKKNNDLVKRELFGVGITNEKEGNILEFIKNNLKNTPDNYYIVTPNPEMLVYAKSHPSFKTLLNNAQIALCDGIGILWAGRMLGISFKQRIPGVDFVKKLCAAGNDWPITVGFLGGRGDVAKRAGECLKKENPGLQVAFAASEWPEERFKKRSYNRKIGISFQAQEKESDILEQDKEGINYGMFNQIDVLFVAYGFPKQEEWMAKHLNKIPVRVMMGVGGALDYISGEVYRAPQWVRFIGFEWLFRLIRQPWRLKRQLALVTFIRLVLLERFKQ